MKVRLFCLMTVVLLAASQASAEAPSEATMAAMGLSGLEIMSDAEGLAVRGFGYRGTSANGRSFAVVSVPATAGSQNSYSAKGKHFSFGANESYAGVEIEVSGGHGGGYGGNSKGSKGGKGGGHGGSKPRSISIDAYGGGFSVAKTK